MQILYVVLVVVGLAILPELEGVEVLEHLVPVVLALLYLILFYLTVVVLCNILISYTPILSSTPLLLLFLICFITLHLCLLCLYCYTSDFISHFETFISFSLILILYSQFSFLFSIKYSLLINIFLRISLLNFKIPVEPPCYVRQSSLSMLYY